MRSSIFAPANAASGSLTRTPSAYTWPLATCMRARSSVMPALRSQPSTVMVSTVVMAVTLSVAARIRSTSSAPVSIVLATRNRRLLGRTAGSRAPGQRNAPGETGARRLHPPYAQAPAAFAGPVLEVAQAAAPDIGGDADAVVEHVDEQVVARLDGEGDRISVTVSDGVADRLADHGDGVCRQRRGHHGVDRTGNAHRW